MITTPPSVLLVEDNPDDAALFQAMLEQLPEPGLELVWVTTLEEARKRVGTDPPDLVLLDLGLGPTEGLETLVSSGFPEQGIPVVVLTGTRDHKLAEAALEAGAQDYLVKDENDARAILRAVHYAMARQRERAVREEAIRRELEMARLREENAFKTQFLNMAAHELATPITPIRFQLSSLASDILGPLQPAQRSALDVVHRNFERLGALIDDLLEASKLQANHREANLGDVDLAHLVRTVADRHRRRASEEGLTLELDLPPTLPCRLDGAQIESTVGHLIANAVKFTPPGGSVTLRAREERGTVHLTVADTGHGITPEEVTSLFEPFSRTHVHEAEATREGTGLGLFICKRIVDLHGGGISLESPGRGKGTVVHLRLPVDPHSNAQGEPRVPPAGDAKR